MDVKEAIRTRRSVKHYDPSHEMTEAEVQELMEHAILIGVLFGFRIKLNVSKSLKRLGDKHR